MQTQDTTYNGWTNYATWRVYLEAFDGMNILEGLSVAEDLSGDALSVYDVAQWAKEYAQDVVYNSLDDTGGGVAEGWALAFLQDVDWASIARHLIENASEAA